MTAINSGLMPEPGFSYSNQLLSYARDQAKGPDGSTLPITGSNTVVMDMNTFTWASATTILGGAQYAASATLPFAKNDLTSNLNGNLSGGAGFADSYYLPLILGWRKDRVSFRILYGFLAPTGRFAAGSSSNVGSGYWTHAPSAGQTFFLNGGKSVSVSTFEMYEIHTTQAGTGTRPGDNLDLDYSVTWAIGKDGPKLQVGAAGYQARQTTEKSGPAITGELARERYAINALGFVTSVLLPERKIAFGVRFYEEFADKSTYQGMSLQLFGSLSF